MDGPPDEIAWIAEARMLSLCGLARSTFQSWIKAGLDIEEPNGAYGLSSVLTVTLLVATRNYLGLEEMVGAWRELTGTVGVAGVLNGARGLKEGERFDVVIEPEHGGIAVARTDAQLVRAVRHPGAPRPVVVLDLTERILLAKRSFARMANRSPRPREKRRGRPASRTAVSKGSE